MALRVTDFVVDSLRNPSSHTRISVPEYTLSPLNVRQKQRQARAGEQAEEDIYGPDRLR